MAITVEIDVAAGVVTLTAEGSNSVADYWKAFEQVRKDPGYVSSMSTLVDMRNVVHEGLPTPEIRRSADLAVDDPDQRRFGRVAIVTADDLEFGMARMYEMLRDAAPRRTRIFRSFDEAYAWVVEARDGDST